MHTGADGVTPEGKKEHVGFQVGVRESAQSSRDLLLDVNRCGLGLTPEIAVGVDALGFWHALDEVFPGTRHQRCWAEPARAPERQSRTGWQAEGVHKTANILNKVAKSVQGAMRADLREIFGAATRAPTEVAMDVFVDKYGAKYERAATCLTKDRDALLAFYDTPAEHRDHLRTSNPIENA